ncbi:MAG: CPBP family intramembrane metalloprotease [Actinomycetia bacterium]|nr:CPBP family intramembrane metalloprotease [Actinomycetes bacterium]
MPATDPPPGVDYTRVLARSGGIDAGAVLAGLAVTLLVMFAIAPSLLQSLIFGLGYALRGHPDTSLDAYSAAARAFKYPEGMLAAHLQLAALIPVTLLVVRYVHHRRGVWLSSVQPGVRWRYLAIVVVVALVVLNGMYWLTTGRHSFVWSPQSGLGGWIVLIVLTAPLQAAGEEYLFRGYLTQAFGALLPGRLAASRWLAVLVSACVFGLAHGLHQDLPLLLTRIGFGALMGALVVITGGLEASIAAHAVNNVSTFIVAALTPGGVASAMALSSATWSQAGINLAAYSIVGLIAWTVGTSLHVARTTPAAGLAPTCPIA